MSGPDAREARPERAPVGDRPAVRVLIVDDHRVVADGLAVTISRDPGLVVAGVAGTVADAVHLASREQPDVVLLDYHLPDGTGVDAAKTIRSNCPNAAMVILTADEGDAALSAAIAAGVAGFLLKSQAAPQVISAVHRAADGEMLIPAAMLAGLIGRQRAQRGAAAPDNDRYERLTDREREVLALMARGADNRAIAERLVVSYATVRTHVQKILDKLEAHSKLEAVARASELGLV